MKKLIITIFLVASFSLDSEVLVRGTITEALNDTSVDREAITKLVIEGTIHGNDYSDSSEWSKFYYLDTTFKNLEEVEILTSQDIPDGGELFTLGLFFNGEITEGALWLKKFSAPNVKVIGGGSFVYCYYLTEVYCPSAIIIKSAFSGCSRLATIYCPLVEILGGGAFWFCASLPSVDFQYVTEIGGRAFYGCSKLVSANFPKAKTIGMEAFCGCQNLKEINFPEVTDLLPFDNVSDIRGNHFERCKSLTKVNFPSLVNIGGDQSFIACSNLEILNFPKFKISGHSTFAGCVNITSVNFGADFIEQTAIKFGSSVFGSESIPPTKNAILTLGPYVLPIADLDNNTWQDKKGNGTGIPYEWKMIKYIGIKNNYDEDINIYELENNIYLLPEEIKDGVLYNIIGQKIMEIKGKELDINYLPMNLYLLYYRDKSGLMKVVKLFKK